MTTDNAAAEHLARKLVTAALGCAPEQVVLSLSVYDIPEWDSVGHMNILLELEKELNTHIKDDETAEQLTVFKNIVGFVQWELEQAARRTA